MLERCLAHLIARDDGQLRMLEKIGTRAGFRAMQPLGGAQAEGRNGLKLNYFLVHHEMGTETLGAVVRSVRASAVDSFRYAPIVLFASDGPYERYLEFIEMGFDDVITLPEKAEIVEQRLSAQLDSEHLYFETAAYFGPDRRRMEIAPPEQYNRSDNPHSHVRHYFRRSLVHGITVSRSESYLGVGHHPLKVERVG